MPQFIAAPINSHMHCGQHYTKRSLRPGKHVYAPGLCFGFTLAWLKNIQMDRTWTSLPSRLEAMLGQHLYAYGHSTRPYARNDWNLAQESADLTEIAQGTSPGSWVQDPELLHCCQLQGFRPTYLGELSTYRILFHLNGCRAGETKTYLLTSAGHALGLAMRRGEIALFDSNTGLTLYSVEEALDNAHLMHCLNLLLAGATFHQFGVLQLTF